MRNQWYGDHRDIVKWSAVYRLAARAPSTVVYIPMLRPDTPSLAALTLDGAVLPVAVVRHFRDASRVSEIAWPEGTRFVALEGEFRARGEYFDRAAALLGSARAAGSGARAVVLLDPDTGIAPASGGDERHVRPDELRRMFRLLGRGDALAVYQHAWRATAWVEVSRAALAAAVDIQVDRVVALQCTTVAADVAMLVASA